MAPSLRPRNPTLLESRSFQAQYRTDDCGADKRGQESWPGAGAGPAPRAPAALKPDDPQDMDSKTAVWRMPPSTSRAEEAERRPPSSSGSGSMSRRQNASSGSGDMSRKDSVPFQRAAVPATPERAPPTTQDVGHDMDEDTMVWPAPAPWPEPAPQVDEAEYNKPPKRGDSFQDARSGVAASCTTATPTVTTSEVIRKAVEQETAVWPGVMPPPYENEQYEQYPWPQDWPQQGSQETSTQSRCSRKAIIVFLLGLGLVVILVVAFVVAQTMNQKQDSGSTEGTSTDPTRGVPVPTPPPTTTTTTTTACSTLVARMIINNRWQRYDENQLHEKMWGIANTTLCLNGTIQASAEIKDFTGGPPPELIAGRIHFVEPGNKTDGADGTGPAVFKFCGIDDDGLGIECGTRQSQVWTMQDMVGEWMQPPNTRLCETSMDQEDCVREILLDKSKTNMFYFSFSTRSSWAHWQNQEPRRPMGAIRGQLERRDP